MIKTVITICIFLSILAPSLSGGEIVDRVIAIVNDDIVTLKDAERYVRIEKHGQLVSVNEYFRNIQIREKIDIFIDDLLIRQQATKLKIQVTDKEVEQVVNNIKKQNLITDVDLQEQLKKDGISYQDFLDGIRLNMLRSRILTRVISKEILVTENMIKDYYNAHKDELRDEEYRVQQIFLTAQRADSQKRAFTAYEQLTKGRSFADVAKQFSDEPTAAQGGDLGFLKGGDLIPALREALNKITPGSITPIIRTPYGFHILKLNEVKRGETPTIEAVRENIQEQIVRDESEKRYKDYIEKLRKSSYIEVKI